MFRKTRCLINKTGYVVFEIGTQCNLGHLHAKCPNRHPDRYKHVDTSRAMSDDTIVDTAVAMIQEHGFRGLIGFHYYNEPTLESKRMHLLMHRIQKREPSAQFVLWTNGTTILVYIEEYERFSQVHITDYQLDGLHSTACLVAEKHGAQVHRWPLDDRLTTTGDEPSRVESDAPCCRMFTEMIFDYYGNVHLCCYDWRGLGSFANLHTSRLAVVVNMWQTYRRLMCRERMTPMQPPPPLLGGPVEPLSVCRTCTAPGRNPHITDFVKAPAEAARAYREEVLNRGN